VTEELIAKIARCLDEKEVPYMIIGGQAVLVYGRARMTRDIDLTLGVDSDQVGMICDLCKEADLNIRVDNPEEFSAETKVLPAEDMKSKFLFDFIFSFTPYERQAIERARSIELGGYKVKFATCEDVIVHKMLASRAVDIDDIRSILAKQGDVVNIEYIRKWLSEFEAMPEFAGIVEKFGELISEGMK